MSRSRDLPVLTLDHGALCPLRDKGRLWGVRLFVNFYVRVLQLALEGQVFFSQRLDLSESLFQLLL